ncbi:MAG: MtnX-like HAD-IB family phosphatase [Bacillota bacterium]
MSDLKDAIILSDFDGTITVDDTNNAIFANFNQKESEEIVAHYRENHDELGIRWLLTEQYKNLEITRQELKEFVINEIAIEPTFFDFLKFIRKNNFTFAVLSGGFRDYINILLEHYGIEEDFIIYANKLVFPEDKNSEDDYIRAEFAYPPEESLSEFGPVPTPKGMIINQYKKEGLPIFYLGDGRTDRHAIGRADYILTKQGTFLEKYCQDNDFEHYVFSDFIQAKNYIIERLKK